MTMNIQGSATKSWPLLTAIINAKVQDAYHRALNLGHRIRYVNNFLLSRARFTIRNFPPPLLQTTTDRQTQTYHGSYGEAQSS